MLKWLAYKLRYEAIKRSCACGSCFFDSELWVPSDDTGYWLIDFEIRGGKRIMKRIRRHAWIPDVVGE